MKAGRNSVLVRVTAMQKEEAEKSVGGIMFATNYHPLAYKRQWGNVIDVGVGVKHIQTGDIAFFTHLVADEPARIVDRDANGSEVWVLMQHPDRYYSDIMAWKSDGGAIIPCEGYVLCQPENDRSPANSFTEKTSTGLHIPGYVQNTKRHFRSVIQAVSMEEKVLKPADHILCSPQSNYEIRYRDNMLWLIRTADVLMVFDLQDSIFVYDKPSGSEQKKLTKEEARKFVLTPIN